MQVPAPTSLTSPAEVAEHTRGVVELNVGVRERSEDAVTEKPASPNVFEESVPNVMV